MGAIPIVCDVFAAAALTQAVVDFGPDAIVNQLTDLPDDSTLIPRHMEANARVRREGTANLLEAGRAAHTAHFVAQSVAWALDSGSAAAVSDLERMVLAGGGVVLRYGRFYGAGTYHEVEPPPPPRIHIDEAARRTVRALRADSGVITVVESEPDDAGGSRIHDHRE
jgi:hypothetical protein